MEILSGNGMSLYTEIICDRRTRMLRRVGEVQPELPFTEPLVTETGAVDFHPNVFGSVLYKTNSQHCRL